MDFVLRALLSAFHAESSEARHTICHQRIGHRHCDSIYVLADYRSVLGAGAWVLVAVCGGLCEGMLGLPKARHSQFQAALIDNCRTQLNLDYLFVLLSIGFSPS